MYVFGSRWELRDRFEVSEFPEIVQFTITSEADNKPPASLRACYLGYGVLVLIRRRVA